MVWSEEAAWESHDCFNFLHFLISFREVLGLHSKKQDKKKYPSKKPTCHKDKHVSVWFRGYTFLHIRTLFCLEQEDAAVVIEESPVKAAPPKC